MNVWHELVRALRETQGGLADYATEGKAMVILDAQIRAADGELDRAREQLATLMARAKRATQQAELLQSRIDEYEGYAQAALAENNQALATQVAERVARFESEYADQQVLIGEYDAAVAQIQRAINQSENTIRRLRQQADTLRATDAVHRAQLRPDAPAGRPRRIETALDSLARMRAREREELEDITAALDVGNAFGEADELDEKLRAAGIKPGKPSADSVLARLKSRQSGER